MIARTWTVTGAKKFFFSLLALMVLATVGLFSSAANAQSNPRYAALVMNADSGDVIYSRYSDARRYPASLTKLMTLYLLFEAIEAGDFTLESELDVSARAAGQPPSKLGVEEGDTITVHDAIQALVVRSANDVAVVVAESIAPSEYSFGQRMTARAREMGMSRTTFRNASGLPNRRQLSTARDLATLAINLVNDFPQHLHYFSQESFTYGERTWNSHNNLLEDYEGTTGLKTGYTRASGFNLIATVERGDISLIGVVMGGRTAATRDTEMERLLDLNFERLEEDPLYGSRMALSDVFPEARPNPASLPAPAPADDANMALAAVGMMPEPRPVNNLLAHAEVALEEVTGMDWTEDPGARPVEENELAEHETPIMDMPAEGNQVAAGDTDPSAPVPSIAQAVMPRQNWGIEIGRFEALEDADYNMQVAAAAMPTRLTWGMAAVFPDRDGRDVSYNAAFGPLAEEEAADICHSLAAQNINCAATENADWDLAIRR